MSSHNQERVMLRVAVEVEKRVVFKLERVVVGGYIEGHTEEEVVVGKQQKGVSHVNYSIASPLNINLPTIDV